MPKRRDQLLLQEYYAEMSPEGRVIPNAAWRVLVCCVLLNQTSRTQVDGMIDEFFLRWSMPDKLLKAQPKEVKALIESLGLGNLRTGTLFEMSVGWRIQLRAAREDGEKLPDYRQVSRIHGLGNYAVDSYRIFVLGDLSGPLVSGDKEIIAWATREWELYVMPPVARGLDTRYDNLVDLIESGENARERKDDGEENAA